MPVNAIAMPFSFAAAIDSSSLIDPPETGDWGQACARLLFLWERLGEGAKLESQKSQT